VTVADQPATIGAGGVTVGPSGAQGGEVAKQISEALTRSMSSFAAEVRLLDSHQEKSAGRAAADSSGVLLSFSANGESLPGGTGVISSILLGKAGALVSASPFAPDEGLGVDVGGLDDVSLPTGALGATGDSGGSGADLGPAPAPLPTGAGRPSAPTAGTGRGAPTTRAVGLLGGVAADRLEILYLAFALAFMGVVIGWRKALPARWPGVHGS
jgi:hypothetical protein